MCFGYFTEFITHSLKRRCYKSIIKAICCMPIQCKILVFFSLIFIMHIIWKPCIRVHVSSIFFLYKLLLNVHYVWFSIWFNGHLDVFFSLHRIIFHIGFGHISYMKTAHRKFRQKAWKRENKTQPPNKFHSRNGENLIHFYVTHFMFNDLFFFYFYAQLNDRMSCPK